MLLQENDKTRKMNTFLGPKNCSQFLDPENQRFTWCSEMESEYSIIISDAMKIVRIISGILIGLILIVFLVRAFSEKQLDDVTPGIPCDQSLLEKTDVYYVIPKFENKSISENKTWCDEILEMNKTLELHGVYHTYNEFKTERDEEYLEEGIKIFRGCFGFNPERFKPPQIAFSDENTKLIKSKMHLDMYMNSVFHKTYHCNDSGIVSNNIMDFI